MISKQMNNCPLKKYKEIRAEYMHELASLYPQAEIDSILHLVLEKISGKRKSDFILNPDSEFSKEDISGLSEALVKLTDSVPVQYVIHEAWFMEQRFMVSPDVLIPRPETEEILYTIKERFSKNAFTDILDIGTGSGCIAISLAGIFPGASVYGIDVSEKALAIAAKNSVSLNADVRWIQADILDSSDALFAAHSLDLIVSNPPYVRQLEKAMMHDNVVKHEPHKALFVPDDNALIFYEAIAKKAALWLKPGGALIFEINEEFGIQTKELLKSNGFTSTEIMKDFRGKDRSVWAVKAS